MNVARCVVSADSFRTPFVLSFRPPNGLTSRERFVLFLSYHSTFLFLFTADRYQNPAYIHSHVSIASGVSSICITALLRASVGKFIQVGRPVDSLASSQNASLTFTRGYGMDEQRIALKHDARFRLSIRP